MKNIIKKYIFHIIYYFILTLFSVFVILDALVIEKDTVQVEKNLYLKEVYESMEKIVTENSYTDDNIKINIKYDRKYDSDIYVADIVISDISFLKSAFAKDMFGKNVIETTSQIAQNNNAIFAVNGDYYGFRDYGFVLRNGVKYRDSARKNGKDACFVIYSNGDTNIINERNANLDEEIKKAYDEKNEILQVYTFGPGLILNNEMITTSKEEEDLVLNPRTAIGMVEPLHYMVVCVDGRTEKSAGVTIAQLAEYMQELNCKNAYNLDGGSSSSMYFKGNVINKPSSGEERWVSDIVYIGY